MNVEITGSVFALDPIFSPNGYARSVFGNNVDMVTFTTEGTRMDFTVIKRVVGDLENFVADLIPSSVDGRKVEVNFKVTT